MTEDKLTHSPTQSRGLYDQQENDALQAEAEYARSHSIGSYFAHHARKQLAFDIWWLGLALWAICIVERTNIDDPETDSYFNIFTIIFEVSEGSRLQHELA